MSSLPYPLPRIRRDERTGAWGAVEEPGSYALAAEPPPGDRLRLRVEQRPEDPTHRPTGPQ